MTYCPFCGSMINDVDLFCPTCNRKLPDNFLQVNRNNQFKSRDDEFLKIDSKSSIKYPSGYYQNQSQNEYPPTYYKSEFPPTEYKESRFSKLYSILSFIIIFILIIATVQAGILDFSPTRYMEFPESAEFTVERSTTISCIQGEADYDLRIPKPVSLYIIDNGNNGYIQQIINVDATGKYNLENNIYHWQEEISGGEHHNIKITYNIKSKTYQWDIDKSNSGTIDDIPSVYTNKYSSTEDEWLIETTNPQVQSLAAQLTQEKTTVYEKVKAIYIYLKENVGYEVLDREPQSCSKTIQLMRGDCDDQSILFSAMCRSLGIPAWLEFGFIYDKSNNQWGGHGWSTVVIPLKNGNIATPHIDIVNRKFLWEDCYRITEWVDDGNGENLKSYYDYFQSRSKVGTKVDITEPYFNTIELKTYGTVKIPVD